MLQIPNDPVAFGRWKRESQGVFVSLPCDEENAVGSVPFALSVKLLYSLYSFLFWSNSKFSGNRPIHASTEANGPDQYINTLPVRKHTSTSIKFNFPYMNLQN